MNKLYKTVKNIIMQTAALSAAIIFAILIFMSLIADGSINPAITLPTASLCLLTAFLFSICNLIFRVRSISLFVRTLLHFFACLIAIVLVVTLGSYEFKDSSLLLIVAYAIVYLLTVPTYLLIAGAIHRKHSEKEDYDSIFSDK